MHPQKGLAAVVRVAGCQAHHWLAVRLACCYKKITGAKAYPQPPCTWLIVLQHCWVITPGISPRFYNIIHSVLLLFQKQPELLFPASHPSSAATDSTRRHALTCPSKAQGLLSFQSLDPPGAFQPFASCFCPIHTYYPAHVLQTHRNKRDRLSVCFLDRIYLLKSLLVISRTNYCQKAFGEKQHQQHSINN